MIHFWKELLRNVKCSLFHRKYHIELIETNYHNTVYSYGAVKEYKCIQCGREWEEVYDFWH